MRRSIQEYKGGKDQLNVQQRSFVNNLLALENFNPTQAARQAGYSQPVQAQAKLLKQPIIQNAVGKAVRERRERLQLVADDVLKHLVTALFLDPLDIWTSENGLLTLKDFEDIPENVRRCITKTKVRTKTTTQEDGSVDTEQYIEVEFMSKDAALPLAMKHLGIAGDDKHKHQFGFDPQTEGLIAHLLAQVDNNANVVDGTVIERKAIEGPKDEA